MTIKDHKWKNRKLCDAPTILYDKHLRLRQQRAMSCMTFSGFISSILLFHIMKMANVFM